MHLGWEFPVTEYGEILGLILTCQIPGSVRGTCCNVGHGCLILAIGRAAGKYKTPVAIAAIDIAMFVNFKIDARVAQRSGPEHSAAFAWAANGRCPVTYDAGLFDKDSFWWRDVHDRAITGSWMDAQAAAMGNF